MMQLLSFIWQWKMILLLAGALAFFAYAVSDLSSVVKEDVSQRQQSLQVDKALAEKTKRIMDYDPSKARLVAP